MKLKFLFKDQRSAMPVTLQLNKAVIFVFRAVM